MASKDLYSSAKALQAFSFDEITGLEIVSLGIDTKQVETILAVVYADTPQGGSFSGTAVIGFEDNDIDSSPSAPWQTVSDDFIVGNPIEETIDAIRIPKKLGYVGKKRFVRVKVTKAGGSSISVSGSFILGVPLNAPTGVQS